MPSDWSSWEWNEAHNCWICSRLKSNGEILLLEGACAGSLANLKEGEYEWKYEKSTNESTEQTSNYPSSTVPAPQSSVEDLNEQYEGLDIGAGHERGRKKVILPIPRDKRLSSRTSMFSKFKIRVLDLGRSKHRTLIRPSDADVGVVS